MTLHVAIFVFDQVEVLDFAGPHEVFTTASRLYARNEPHAVPLFQVFTLGQSRAPLRARAGLSIHPEHDFKQHPAIDVLIVPGGVISAELAKPAVIEWIKETYIQHTHGFGVYQCVLVSTSGAFASTTRNHALGRYRRIRHFVSDGPSANPGALG